MENYLLILLLSLLIEMFRAYHAYKQHETTKTLIASAKHNQSLNAQNELSRNDLLDNKARNLLESKSD
jgi:hypothetical protein